MHASARSSASISSRKCDPDRLLVADVAREKPNIVGYLGQAAGFAWDHRVDDGDIPALPYETSDQIGADGPAAARHHHTSAHQCTNLVLPTAK
jgi:hypothetical protein